MTHNFIQLIILMIGFFLIFALFSGKIMSLIKIPKVTGYLLVGLIFASLSPEFLSSIFPNYQNISLNITIASESQPIKIMDIFKVIKNIGLGLIVFNIGGEFQLEHFKRLGTKVIWISFFEILFTSVIVSIFCLICFVTLFQISLTNSISYSILLGIIAIATAPAATLLVLREYESEGPVTNHILVLIGLNNIICILFFKLVFSGFVSESHNFMLPLIEILVSIGLGILVGLLISLAEKWFDKPVELLMLVLGGITVNIGLAYLIQHGFNIELSTLLANLFMGIALINSTTKGNASFNAIRNADLPIYAIFFVLAGANLHIDTFLESGKIGFIVIMVYVAGRSFGKLFGTSFGVKFTNLQSKLKNNVGLGLLPQAGVAIGLATLLKDGLTKQDPQMAITLSTLILSAVIIFELVGPLFTRHAIIRAGEVKEISLSKKTINTAKKRYHRVLIRLRQSLGIPKWKNRHHKDIRCKDVMRSSVEPILDSAPFDEVMQHASQSKYSQFQVVDDNNYFIGTITHNEIRDILLDPEFAHLIIARDILQEDPPVARPEDSLQRLLNLFHVLTEQPDYLPVIDDHDPPHLIGMVTQKDVIAAFSGKTGKDNQQNINP